MDFGDWWSQAWSGFSGWWLSITWGSAADWVAGVATVGALFLGLSILSGDRKVKRRELADSFSTWWEIVVEGRSDENGETSTHELRLHAYNAGLLPVQGAAVTRPNKHDEDFLFHEFLKETGVDEIEVIEPGERTDRVLSFSSPPASPDYFITFSDGRGRTWHRALGSGKYVLRKKAMGF